MSSEKFMQSAHQRLIAKALSELHYEGMLNLQPTDIAGFYRLELSSGVEYRFKAWQSCWDHLVVDSKNLQRICKGHAESAENAGQFFRDAQGELELSDIVLSHFIEEMLSSLYSEVELLKKNETVSVEQLAELSSLEVQSYLYGHPKILLNKGRIGWGAADLNRYAPESAAPFQLHWLDLRNSLTNLTSEQRASFHRLNQMALSEKEEDAMRARFSKVGARFEDYLFLPVHPWQWEKVISLYFAEDLAKGNLIALGTAGDLFCPQISLRTLSNVSRPQHPDIKLSLNILNTSAYRGIASKYGKTAASLSKNFSELLEQDVFLKSRNTQVLQDLGAVAFEHSEFAKLPEAPYRYKEFLGAIWRESSDSKQTEEDQVLLTAALHHRDFSGKSLLSEYVRLSGESIENWLRGYFDVVVLPLLHLQHQYGIGLVAHGQNIQVHLKNYKPYGMFLKDFQGDLRLAKERERPSGLRPENTTTLDRLPAEYLIQDLITGHFVTVLRFISQTLFECNGYPEEKFYGLLAEALKRYGIGKENSIFLKEVFSTSLPRVLLNKVRFSMGYQDTAERLKPLLGKPLKNPFCQEKYHEFNV
ncbi:MAG: siderophore biosynthesis protein IucC [Bdellovibrionales bacterium]|nr:siderophore biosynthesis protein IucC [Bdellovibrionales bacterium]